MSTFTWTPDFGASKKSNPVVQKIKFGDGYEQRATVGINTNPKTWTVRFSLRDTAEADAIDAFLDARGGVESFDWTPPGGSSAKFVCREWDRSIDHAGIYTVSATFEQVFEP